MPPDLSHAFKGMDAEDHMVRRFLMVGAHPDEKAGRSLSLTDHLLMRAAVRYLDVLKIPVSEAVRATRDPAHDPDPSIIRPICILEEYGGENFLVSEEKGEVVVLCNISKEDRFGDNGHPLLRKSFKSAHNHSDLDAWNAQLLKAGANVTFIFGVDNFEVGDFNKRDFIQIKLDGPLSGILINRAFFAKAAYFLLEKDSPLVPIIGYYDNPDMMFRMDSFATPDGTIRAFTP